MCLNVIDSRSDYWSDYFKLVLCHAQKRRLTFAAYPIKLTTGIQAIPVSPVLIGLWGYPRVEFYSLFTAGTALHFVQVRSCNSWVGCLLNLNY